MPTTTKTLPSESALQDLTRLASAVNEALTALRSLDQRARFREAHDRSFTLNPAFVEFAISDLERIATGDIRLFRAAFEKPESPRLPPIDDPCGACGAGAGESCDEDCVGAAAVA